MTFIAEYISDFKSRLARCRTPGAARQLWIDDTEARQAIGLHVNSFIYMELYGLMCDRRRELEKAQ